MLYVLVSPPPPPICGFHSILEAIPQFTFMLELILPPMALLLYPSPSIPLDKPFTMDKIRAHPIPSIEEESNFMVLSLRMRGKVRV
jgi:hypothetical protein